MFYSYIYYQAPCFAYGPVARAVSRLAKKEIAFRKRMLLGDGWAFGLPTPQTWSGLLFGSVRHIWSFKLFNNMC